jgi:hypothetical protein
MNDATMSPQELQAIMLLLGDRGQPIRQGEFGYLVGTTGRQVRRWIKGITTIPPLRVEKIRSIAAAAAGGRAPGRSPTRSR